MAQLPTGTVTFLFSDIEGSTGLVGALGDRYGAVLDRHHSLLREAIAAHDGVEVMTEGDAFFVVFRSPQQAVDATLAAQRALHTEPWPEDGAVRVRTGIHTGEAVLGGDNYVGLDVHRAARIAAAGHGGQVLMSDATRALVERNLPAGAELRDLGAHRLKDLPQPERIYQLSVGDLPADFPSIRSLDLRPNNLPSPVTTFVGRESQTAEIVTRLKGARLLTLTGPGGTGKTRLSIRVAQEVLPDFADGCWFVALDALRDPDLVPAAIASAVGVHVAGDRPVIAALEAWLAQREVLLVLDNFEQVTAAAPAVAQLLSAAPGLRVLATSRNPLHLYGEVEYAVPPLGLVSELRAAASSPEALSQYEAVRLFIERALAVKPDFAVTNSNAPAVAEICARLDGLPLAIELAAARVKLLGPEQILDRLNRNLSVLASAAQDLSERQRTMTGAIDWSFSMLKDAERGLFVRLSVFRGGFTLESADEVCAQDLPGDLFEALASLVDKSLLTTSDALGHTRFAQLETIRDFAAERLAGSGDEPILRRRHAEHYFALARESEGQLTGGDQVEWLDRLEREHHNLRAAFERAEALGLVDAALEAAGAIWRFWHQRGHIAEARAVYERLLALPSTDPRARAKALVGAGGIAYWQNDFATMGGWYRLGRELYESAGDDAGTAEALYNEAFIPLLEGDFETANRMLDRASALFGGIGDELGVARSANFAAYTKYFLGRPQEALESLVDSTEIYRRKGERLQLADTLTGVAYTHAMLGDWRRAAELMRESLTIFAESGNDLGISMVLQATAASASAVGEHELAARLFGAAEQLKERAGGSAPAQMIQTDDQRELTLRALGDDGFAALHRDGTRLPRDEAIALALAFEPSPDAAPMPPPKPWGVAAQQAEAGEGASG